MEIYSHLSDCLDKWLDSLVKLNDNDLIKELQTKNCCTLNECETKVSSFNYNPNWVSICLTFKDDDDYPPRFLTVNKRRI